MKTAAKARTGTDWRKIVGFTLFSGLMLLALVLANSGRAAIETPPPPSVWSDKADYAPGEQVTLSGANWAPGESVHIRVNDDAGETWRRDVDVTAADDGTISDQFNLPNWFVAQYTVTATGASSGTATWTFTDSNPQSIAVSPASVSVAQGSNATYTATLTTGGNTNPCTVTFSATGLPAGASAAFAPSFVTTTGGPSTTTLTVSTTSTTPTGSFPISVSGTNSGAGCQGPGATAATPTLVVTSGTVNTTTVAQSKTATYGDSSVSLSATVSPSTVNVGTVTFTIKDGATTVGTATSGTVSGGSATASFSLSGVNAKTYTIQAAYSGGTGFNSSNNSTQSPAPTLTVNKKNATWTTNANSKTYGSPDPSPLTTGSGSGFLVADGVTASYGRTAGESVAGSPYHITATLSAAVAGAQDNYNITNAGADFTIEQKAASVTPDAKSKEYGDADPTLTGTLSGFLAADGVTASYGRTAGESVAGSPYEISATLSPAGVLGNYDITYNTANFTITRAVLSVNAADKTKTYGDADPAGTYTLSGFKNGEDATSAGVTGTASCAAGSHSENVGTYNDVYSCAPNTLVAANYSFAAGSNGKLTIEQAALNIYAVGDSKVYDATTDSSEEPLVVGMQFSDTVTGKVQKFQSKNVMGSGGSTLEVTAYTVNDGNSGLNYDVTTHTASGTITKAPLSISAVSETKVYDGTKSSDETPTVSGLLGSDTVTGKAQEFQSKDVKGAGLSTLVVTAYTVNDGNSGDNYSVTTPTAPGTVTKAPLSISAVSDSKVYDGNRDSNGNPTVSGLQTGDSATGKVQKFQSKNVMGSGGSTLEVTAYTVNDGNSGLNYDVTTHTASGTITKAPLTVTADNKTMTVNGTVPTLTYAISGFVGDETLSTSGVMGSASCSTADGTTVGTFEIVCGVGTLSATNYSFATFVKGTLTVKYSTATCFGAAGHTILQPINTDGTSVFKQGSTVPAKFRVCDANGNSIGTAGVVTEFKLVQTFNGTETSTVNETVDSTTPDTAFRWSSTDQQWIFNINTKKQTANKTYVYKISLNDGTYIQFQLGLK